MTKTFKLDKLVRDKTYQMMIDEKMEFTLKPLSSHNALLTQFKAKLLEEAHEVAQATTQQEMILELADCLEVIHEFANTLGISFDEVETQRQSKRQKQGGFEKKIVVDTVTAPIENPWVSYFLKNPNKYPEITNNDAI